MNIEDFCRINSISHYEITEDNKINTRYGVNLSRMNLDSIPFKFGIVNGNFDISGNNLTDLEGCPDVVTGYFSAANNKLTSLKGCPNKIDKDLYLYQNYLTDLEHFPKKIKASVYIRNNKLTSLKGCARKIKGDFIVCENETLTSLKYGPQYVEGDYNVISCNIRTLESLPNSIGSDWLPLYNNPVHLIVDSNKFEDLLAFKECKVIRNDKLVFNRLKLYLNIIGSLNTYKVDRILSEIKDDYEIA
jgi:hypothetical protein